MHRLTYSIPQFPKSHNQKRRKVYFRKLFCEIYGTSPIKYVNNLRIKKAKEALGSDYSSISDIALMLGFNNIYEFSRAFKAHTGSSPTEYAKKIRN